MPVFKSNWKNHPEFLAHGGTGITGGALVSDGRFLYYLGGARTPDFVRQQTIFAARLEADGAVGEWRAVARFPKDPNLPSAVYHDGFIYIYGGTLAPADDFYSVKVNGDGTLGKVNTLKHMTTTGLPATPLVVWAGWIYSIGGTSSVAGGKLVWSARLGGDGSVGAWKQVGETPSNDTNGVAHHACLVYGGHMYLFGGVSPTGTANSWVWSAKLESGGGLGQWRKVGDMPYAVQRGGCQLVGDRAVVFGGTNGAVNVTMADAFEAPMLPNGEIGAFTRLENLPLALYNLHTQSVVVGNRLYVAGGSLTSTSYTPTVRSILVGG